MRHLPDLLMTIGAAVLCYGAWLVYEPAGYLVGGTLMITAGVLAARATK
jgi:hypothetical protein